MQRYVSIRLALCIVFTLGSGVPACTKQEIALNGANPSGVYTLASVNGVHVPGDISHEGTSLKVLSGTMTINTDGTTNSKTVFVSPAGTEMTREVTATYTKNGSRLAMQWQGAGTTVGTVQGDTFTMINEGMEFVYSK